METRNELKKEILKIGHNEHWVRANIEDFADRAEVYMNKALERGIDQMYDHKVIVNKIAFHVLEECVE